MTPIDVIIIGAGAAGSSAAFHLARNGHKVTLLDKNSSSQIKPCSGGMAASVQGLFPFELSPAVDEMITRVEFSWCLSDQVIADLPGSAPFWIVRREKLDNLITDKAVNEGAELMRPFNVTSLTKEGTYWLIKADDGRELAAKIIVIADGSLSPWPKVFGLGPQRQHHASTTSVRLKGKGNLQKETARFEFGLVRHGFAWAFPFSEGVNVGIGTFIGSNQTNHKIVLEKLLPSLGFDPEEGERTEASLRVWNGHHSLNSERMLIIGDAASLCDPFLAEGLRPALISGCEAAHCINTWLEGKSKDLNNYTQTMKSKWGNSMAWGRRISQVFYRFPKVGYQLGIKRPTAPQRIAQILSGEMGYEDIAQRVIKRLIFQNNKGKEIPKA